MTIWYSSIFVSSSMILFLIAYLLLSSIVKEQDRKIIELKINEYALMERAKGLKTLLEEIRQEYKSNKAAGFFVRVADSSNRTLILTTPPHFKRIDYSPLENENVTKGDHWLFLKKKDDDDTLEIKSRRLKDGYILQIGKGSEEREDLLEHFREIFAIITIPVVLIAISTGAFLAFRSLRPIRDLINTVREIDLGRMDSRVPSYKTGDELDELVRLFNNMLQRIQSLINGMRQSLDYVAHDLRTPITRMRAVIEGTLQDDPDKAALREALMDCAEESERISSMLNTLMDISEAESGVMNLKREEVDVWRLISGIVELYQYIGEEKGIKIKLMPTGALKARIDKVRMRQVLANLMDNAIKYGIRGTKVIIEARCHNSDLEITVTDSGKGIDEKDIPRIFDKLYRADRNSSEKGLGLGLSLVKAVVTAHGGRVEVSSRLGKGSSFKVILPGTCLPIDT